MKRLLALGLLAVPFVFPWNADAAIQITSVSLTPDTVEMGGEFDVSVTVLRDATDHNTTQGNNSGGCWNNWVYTTITIDGVDHEFNHFGAYFTSGTNTEIFSLTAPLVAGPYDVTVQVNYGAEPGYDHGSTCEVLTEPYPPAPVTKSLEVTEAPWIVVSNLTPQATTSSPGQTINYTATVEVGGYPEIWQHLCTVWDVYPLADGWTEQVQSPAQGPGAYDITWSYPIPLSASPADLFVKVIVFDKPCDDSAISGSELNTVTYNVAGTFAVVSLEVGETDNGQENQQPDEDEDEDEEGDNEEEGEVEDDSEVSPLSSGPQGSSKPDSRLGGEVLGDSTEGEVLGESCIPYMTPGGLIRMGANNDPEQVMKLQTFLNKWMNASLPVTGFYGPLTQAAVMAFQLQHADEILAPWGLTTPTGIVYLTTLRWINSMECPGAVFEMPSLS